MAKPWYNFFVVTDGRDARAADPTPAPSEPASPQRVIDVVPDAAADTAFTGPVSNPTALGDIYQSAQISTPPHGYSVLKVAEMLQSEHLRGLPAEVKRKSVMVALEAAGVQVNDIVEDAVHRDRALDTYERVLQTHLDDLRAQKEAENARLEEEVNQRLTELRARIEANNQEIGRQTKELQAWRTRKHQEEDRIADAVSYFVSENPITTSGLRADSEKGADHVR